MKWYTYLPDYLPCYLPIHSSPNNPLIQIPLSFDVNNLLISQLALERPVPCPPFFIPQHTCHPYTGALSSLMWLMHYMYGGFTHTALLDKK